MTKQSPYTDGLPDLIRTPVACIIAELQSSARSLYEKARPFQHKGRFLLFTKCCSFFVLGLLRSYCDMIYTELLFQVEKKDTKNTIPSQPDKEIQQELALAQLLGNSGILFTCHSQAPSTYIFKTPLQLLIPRRQKPLIITQLF